MTDNETRLLDAAIASLATGDTHTELAAAVAAERLTQEQRDEIRAASDDYDRAQARYEKAIKGISRHVVKLVTK